MSYPLPPLPLAWQGEDRHAPVAQGEDVHVCTVRRSDEKEGWVEARLLDMDEGGREVPGAPVYLPVMILRDSGREVSLATRTEQSTYNTPNRSIGVRCCVDLTECMAWRQCNVLGCRGARKGIKLLEQPDHPRLAYTAVCISRPALHCTADQRKK